MKEGRQDILSAIKKIGFIGTGIMGAAMAGHLMDAGFEVSVYNRTKSKAQALIDRGNVLAIKTS